MVPLAVVTVVAAATVAVVTVRDGSADLAAVGFGDRSGVGSAFGAEGAFHLGRQGQQQEDDAAHASSAVLSGAARRGRVVGYEQGAPVDRFLARFNPSLLMVTACCHGWFSISCGRSPFIGPSHPVMKLRDAADFLGTVHHEAVLDAEAEAARGLDRVGLAGVGCRQHPRLAARGVLAPDRDGQRRAVWPLDHRQRADVRLGQELFTFFFRECRRGRC